MERSISDIDLLETLTKEILLSAMPSHYNELFVFLKNYFEAEKVFIWKFKEAQTQKKKSYLSSDKSKSEEFNALFEEFKKQSFSENISIFKKNIYLRFPKLDGTDFYCIAIKNADVNKMKDAFFLKYFPQKIKSLFHIIERLTSVQQLNFIDDVTGLYNQRFLNVLLDQEIGKGDKVKNYFSVLFIDVDHFKSVNDKNGHLIGSKILKEISVILKTSVRTIDYCFRYGGDEFIVFLPRTRTLEAIQVGERICEAVRETPFIVSGRQIQVTLSVGVACYPEHAKTKEKILQVADEAMYSGKAKSRNTVYVAS